MEYKCRNRTALDNGVYSGWLTIDALKPISAAIKYANMLNEAGHDCKEVEIDGYGNFKI